MLCDGNSYDLIQGQGQGHGGSKFMKIADFKVYLLHQYARNQKTNGGLPYSKTISTFLRTEF